MANSITAPSASTTITFGIVGNTVEGGSGNIAVELDAEANLDRTTFTSNDTVYFLVYLNPYNLNISTWSSHGSVVSNGTKTVTIEETITFVNSNQGRLQYIPSGAVTMRWLGSQTCALSGTATNSGEIITTPLQGNGVLSCRYETLAKSYKLNNVTIPSGNETVQVLVVLTGSL